MHFYRIGHNFRDLPIHVPHSPMFHQSQARMVLITPFWKTQSWFPWLWRYWKSTTSPTRPGCDANQTRVSNVRGSSTTDHLAHLRESYSSQGLSDEVSKLMLSSWRDTVGLTPITDLSLLSGLIGVSNGIEIPILHH